jgi:hypothetical protein
VVEVPFNRKRNEGLNPRVQSKPRRQWQTEPVERIIRDEPVMPDLIGLPVRRFGWASSLGS